MQNLCEIHCIGIRVQVSVNGNIISGDMLLDSVLLCVRKEKGWIFENK